MGEHPHPDTSIVHHDTAHNEPQHEHDPYALADEPQEASGLDDPMNLADPGEPPEPPEPPVGPVAGPLIPPRRFLLCLDDDLDEDMPLVETISPETLGRIDPARVRGHGLETGRDAILSLGSPGGEDHELARCTSALSALALFGRVLPLRLVFLDPA